MANYLTARALTNAPHKTAEQRCIYAVEWLSKSGTSNNLIYKELDALLDIVNSYIGYKSSRDKITKEQALIHKSNIVLAWIKKGTNKLLEKQLIFVLARLPDLAENIRQEIIAANAAKGGVKKIIIGGDKLAEESTDLPQTSTLSQPTVKKSSSLVNQATSKSALTSQRVITTASKPATASKSVNTAKSSPAIIKRSPVLMIKPKTQTASKTTPLKSGSVKPAKVFNPSQQTIVSKTTMSDFFTLSQDKINKLDADALIDLLQKSDKVAHHDRYLAVSEWLEVKENNLSNTQLLSLLGKQGPLSEIKLAHKSLIINGWFEKEGSNLTKEQLFNLFAKGGILEKADLVDRRVIIDLWLKKDGNDFTAEEFIGLYKEGGLLAGLNSFTKETKVQQQLNKKGKYFSGEQFYNLFERDGLLEGIDSGSKFFVLEKWFSEEYNNLTFDQLFNFFDEKKLIGTLAELPEQDKFKFFKIWLEKEENNLTFDQLLNLLQGNGRLAYLQDFFKSQFIETWLKKEANNLDKEQLLNLFDLDEGILSEIESEDKASIIEVWAGKKENNPLEILTDEILNDLTAIEKVSIFKAWFYKVENNLDLQELINFLNDGNFVFSQKYTYLELWLRKNNPILTEQELINILEKIEILDKLQPSEKDWLLYTPESSLLSKEELFVLVKSEKGLALSPKIILKLTQRIAQTFSKEELLHLLSSENAVAKLDDYQKMSILEKWLEKEGNNLTNQEYSSLFKNSESVFFSVINPHRKNLEDVFKNFASENPDKNINATLVELSSETRARVNTYADTRWVNCPIMVFDQETLFDKYFPTDIGSDGYTWIEGIDVFEQREEMLKFVKETRSGPNSYKPSRNAALIKNRELFDRYTEKESEFASAFREVSYLNTSGEEMFQLHDVKSENEKLQHNECHLFPNILDLKSISVTQDNLDHDNPGIMGVMSKKSSILSAIYLKDLFDQKKQKIVKDLGEQGILNLEKKKFERLTTELEYFTKTVSKYNEMLLEIAEIQDEDFNVKNLKDSKLKDALLRKAKKDGTMAVSGKYGKENAIRWLRTNLAKIEIYSLDLNRELQNASHNLSEDGRWIFNETETKRRIAEKVNRSVAFSVYDASKANIRYYSKEETEELRKQTIQSLRKEISVNLSQGKSHNFLVELVMAQTPVTAIKNILSELQLSHAEMYTIIRSNYKNILEPALLSKNPELALYVFKLISPFMKERSEEKTLFSQTKSRLKDCSTEVMIPIARQIKCDKKSLENIFFEIKHSEDSAEMQLSDLCLIAKELDKEYSKDFLPKAFKMLEHLELNSKSLGKVVDFVSVVSSRDKASCIDLFAKKSEDFSKDKIDAALAKREKEMKLENQTKTKTKTPSASIKAGRVSSLKDRALVR